MSHSIIPVFGPMKHVRPVLSGHIVFGGGGGKAPSDVTQRTISLPKFAESYYERMLAGAEQATRPFASEQVLDASGQPIQIATNKAGEPVYMERTVSTYQPYTDDRLALGANVADIAASREAVRGISQAGIPGADISRAAFERGIGALQGLGQYAPGEFTATEVSPYSGFSAATFDPFTDFTAGEATAYTFDPTRQFSGEEVEQYMSPYIQNVLERQMEEARRQSDINRASRSARAVQSSAFGGSRAAVQEALAEEAMARQQGDIYAGGMQSAFESAQQAFQSDRAAQFQRELSQAAELARAEGINIGEAARVQQSLAAERARVEAARAAEAARIQAAEAAELARTQGISVAEAARVQAANEASRQFGYGQGLAAEQAALNAAQGLFGIGERERAAGIQGAQLMEAIGKDQLAEQQALLDLDYQSFLEQRDYPIMQYERFANILSGLPAGFNVTSQGYQSYNPTQQMLGGLMSIGGLYGAYGGQ